eukprot:6965308-Prymnesium_polylepis.1
MFCLSAAPSRTWLPRSPTAAAAPSSGKTPRPKKNATPIEAASLAGYAAYISTPRPDQRAESINNLPEALDFIGRLQELSDACLARMGSDREHYRPLCRSCRRSAGRRRPR